MIENRSYICHVDETTLRIGRLVIGFGRVNNGAWRVAWVLRFRILSPS
jgi:hypothetical protein